MTLADVGSFCCGKLAAGILPYHYEIYFSISKQFYSYARLTRLHAVMIISVYVYRNSVLLTKQAALVDESQAFISYYHFKIGVNLQLECYS